MKLKTEEVVETNASLSGLEINRPRTRAYIKQEAEDNKESLKRALYSPVKIEPSSLEVSNCESTLSTSARNRHCSICNIAFWTPDLYLKHELHSHKTKETPIIDLKTFTCNICNSKLSCLRSYRRHMANLNNIHIPPMYSSSTLNIEDVSYCCNKCDFTLDSREAYYTHLTDAHNISILKPSRSPKIRFDARNTTPTIDILNMYCDVCNKKYSIKKTYIRHLVLIHGITLPDAYFKLDNFNPKTRHCKVCDVKYTRHAAFTVHLKNIHHITLPSHSDLKPNINDQNNYCTVCNKIFCQKSSYIRHLTDIHLDQLPELYQGTDCKNPKKDDRRFGKYCVDCQKVCLTKLLYRFHLEKIHGIKLLNYLPKGVDPNISNVDNRCTLCDKAYYGKDVYISHMLHVHNLNMCKRNVCISNRAPVIDVLKPHCNVCDKTYKTLRHYHDHMSRYHHIIFGLTKASLNYVNRNETPVVDKTGNYCTACEKTYINRESYSKHLYKIHSIRLPKRRPRESRMNRDIIPDRDDKNNHCASCDKTFLNRHSYLRHLVGVHNIKKTKG